MIKDKRYLFVFLLLFLFNSLIASECKIKGTKGKWYFEVDGKPFTMKGAGCASTSDDDGTDYLALAKEMGGNTVRTWGIDQGNRNYLDIALKYGLKVNAGIWMPHCNWMKQKNTFSYISDKEKLLKLENETLDYVRKHKDHPAVMLWNIGNEVLFFTNQEEERIAFCKFLESLIKKVKSIDTSHPVLYACAGAFDLKYIKKYVPSLDLIGFNSYGNIESMHNEWMKLEFSVPYILTECGPRGPWDRPKDQFDKSIDEADYEKAFHYQLFLEDLSQFNGYCLGLFVFHLGDTTQESLTWWNLTYRQFKRESYHIVRKFYTGNAYKNKPPVCTKLEIDKNIVKPGDTITATTTAYDKEKDALSYDILVSTSYENLLLHKANRIVPVKSSVKGDKIEFTVPETPDIYKLHIMVYDTSSNVAIRTLAFKVE